MVIPSRADLAVQVLWPQPFLVIIPQPKEWECYRLLLDILDIIGYYWILSDIIGLNLF